MSSWEPRSRERKRMKERQGTNFQIIIPVWAHAGRPSSPSSNYTKETLISEWAVEDPLNIVNTDFSLDRGLEDDFHVKPFSFIVSTADMWPLNMLCELAKARLWSAVYTNLISPSCMRLPACMCGMDRVISISPWKPSLNGSWQPSLKKLGHNIAHIVISAHLGFYIWDCSERDMRLFTIW